MDASEKPDVNAVWLRNAVLCADCEVISDSPHDACSVCGSHSLLSISRILGGTLPAQRAQMVEARERIPNRPTLALVRRMPHKRVHRFVA
jgi:hypothetical protein